MRKVKTQRKIDLQLPLLKSEQKWRLDMMHKLGKLAFMRALDLRFKNKEDSDA